MSVIIHTLALGPMLTNCVIVAEGDDCWVVDPGMDAGPLIDWLKENGLTPSRILLTHGHGDHIGGVDLVKETFGDAKICCPGSDVAMLADSALNLSGPFGLPVTSGGPDETIEAGQMLSLGQTRWQVIDVSGHTAGGVAFYCESENILLAGDALFRNSIGRCDLPGSDGDLLVANIRKNLLALPGETRVICGHGPDTSICFERDTNPYLG